MEEHLRNGCGNVMFLRATDLSNWTEIRVQKLLGRKKGWMTEEQTLKVIPKYHRIN